MKHLSKDVTKQKSLHMYRKKKKTVAQTQDCFFQIRAAQILYQSVPSLIPGSFWTPGLPTRPPPGLVLAPGGREAALTVGSELKLQEFVAELALVTHIITQIKVTLHCSQKATESVRTLIANHTAAVSARH